MSIQHVGLAVFFKSGSVDGIGVIAYEVILW